MLSAICNIWCGIWLGITPVEPPKQTTTIDAAVVFDIRKLCREDLAQYANGNEGWLARKVAGLSYNQQQNVLTYCAMYAIGMVDGIAIEVKTREGMEGK